jgi:hypothetical protein
MDEPAENVDRSTCDAVADGSRAFSLRLQVEAAVWPGGMVMLQVFGQDPVQLSVVPDQGPVPAGTSLIAQR